MGHLTKLSGNARVARLQQAVAKHRAQARRTQDHRLRIKAEKSLRSAEDKVSRRQSGVDAYRSVTGLDLIKSEYKLWKFNRAKAAAKKKRRLTIASLKKKK